MATVRKGSLWVAFLGGVFVIGIYGLPTFLQSSYDNSQVSEGNPAEVVEPKVLHLNTPEPLKALYMTACVASTPSWRSSLKNLIETTELNAVVIDIKDYTGVVSFPNDFPKADLGKGCVVSDMKDFIEELHNAEIYVIGRISVFQDPAYASLFPELAVKSLSTGEVWKDHKGLSFIDVGATPYWDYIIDISKEAYAIGFDELNYDYIRYPSDGNMQDTDYTWTPYQDESGTGQAVGTTTQRRLMTKPEVLESFFKYLSDEVEDIGVVTSADLFGMTTTVNVDMGIGQILEKALPYFDYVAPMVYPSHYPKTWNGFANPAEHPYEVVKLAMQGGIDKERTLNLNTGNFYVDENGSTTTPKSKLRTWIQDFDLGATYNAPEVRAQIQATYDVGLDSWMLWSAANKYTSEALLLK